MRGQKLAVSGAMLGTLALLAACADQPTALSHTGPISALSGVSAAATAGSWKVVPSPNGGSQAAGNTLLATEALSPTDAWAVPPLLY